MCAPHPLSQQTLLGYNPAGDLAEAQDPLGNTTRMQTDGAGRTVKTVTPKSYDWLQSWNGKSQPRVETDPLGGKIERVYDQAGRLVSIWDQNGNPVAEVQDTPHGFNRIDYQYDTLDRRISRKVNGGDETKYSYNKAGQLTQIQYKGETTGYQYDAAGRLASKTLPGGITQSYTLDAASRLKQIQYRNGATLIDQLDLAYDAEGNSTQKKLANGSLNQDTALTASFDAANRMTQITVNGKTYSLAYDNNGNLTGKTNTADAADATTYTWDARNRLTAITAPGTTASFQYDPLGRRIERTVNGVTTSYLYDGNQAIGEVRAGQTTTLLTGLSIDEAIARYASTGRLTQFTDQLGSVIRQINVAGTTQSSTAYSPYGEAVTTGNDLGSSTEYTGRENDDTGLYFYRARYYDPVLKRFISEDPIGTAGGLNLYVYVGGNPISFVDPTGEYGLPGAAFGASINFGLQFGANLYQSGSIGTALKCIDWGDVAISGVLGAVGPGLGNLIPGRVGPGGLTAGQNAYIYTTKSIPVGFALKRGSPPWRLGNDCECAGLGLGNALGQLIQ